VLTSTRVCGKNRPTAVQNSSQEGSQSFSAPSTIFPRDGYEEEDDDEVEEKPKLKATFVNEACRKVIFSPVTMCSSCSPLILEGGKQAHNIVEVMNLYAIHMCAGAQCN
jgi:hypothetical protein